MTEKIIIGLAAGILGLVSGLLIPVVKWEIEKRRRRREYRESLIKRWREAIETYPEVDDGKFGNTEAYSSLRSHMREKVIQGLRGSTDGLCSWWLVGSLLEKQMLLDEVARLEKKWGLV